MSRKLFTILKDFSQFSKIVQYSERFFKKTQDLSVERKVLKSISAAKAVRDKTFFGDRQFDMRYGFSYILHAKPLTYFPRGV